MNSTPPSGLTSRMTCGDPGSSVWRIITPVFAKGWVLSSSPTNAVISPSRMG